MDNIQLRKKQIRTLVANLKATYNSVQLDEKSNEIMSKIESMSHFREAKVVFVYNNMKDEVRTMDFIRRWIDEKVFYLPVTLKDDIVFRRYTLDSSLQESSFGILEPEGEDLINYKQVDLIIVPGVAFDNNMNRLGRGKGYYDRFLSQTKAVKIGVCFDFQLLDNIPADNYDVKMDFVVSEMGIVGYM